MEDRPFLALVPKSIASKFFRVLRGPMNYLLKFFPTLKSDLKAFNTKMGADDYLAYGFISYLILGLLIGTCIWFVLSQSEIASFRALLVGFLVGFVVIFLFLFLAAKHPTSVITEKSILIDKYLLYALRDLSLQLQSGQTIFGGIVAVSDAKYAEVSAEFYLVAQKVNSGKPLEDVLHDRLQFIRSDYLKKTYWQIINSIRSGSDLRGGLSSIIEQLNNEQKTKIQNYARELNLWSLVYMLFAVAIPTIGSTMLVILSTFASFGVSPQMFILFIVCCFIVQTALIFFVKSRRPVVQF